MIRKVMASMALAAVTAHAQSILLKEDFEDASVEYVTSIPEFTDGAEDFFIRTDGTAHAASISYNAVSGSHYFAGMDLDGEGAVLPLTMTFSGIDISGFSNLRLSVLLAEDIAADGAGDWDSGDYVHVDCRVDGGDWIPMIWLENSGASYNTEACLDTDFDGIGDGPALTGSFALFEAFVLETGALFDLRITMNLDSGDEDIALDNVTLTGTSGSTSSGIDLRAYQAADGVVVEFVAHDVEADGSILLQLIGAEGEVQWSGTVDVTAGPQAIARFPVPGLELGQAYSFKVRDEVGQWWSVDGVVVRSFDSEVTGATLTGITITFDSLPEREYTIWWTGQLGGVWQPITNVTAAAEQITLVVPHPAGAQACGFFRVQAE